MIKSKLLKIFSTLTIFCLALTLMTFIGCDSNKDHPETGPKIVSVDGGSLNGNNIFMVVDSDVTAVSLADKIVSEDGSTWSLCIDVREEISNKVATFDDGLKPGDNVFYVLVTWDGVSSIYKLTIHRRLNVEVRYRVNNLTVKTEYRESYREHPIDYVPVLDGYEFYYWKNTSGKLVDTIVTTNRTVTLYAEGKMVSYDVAVYTDDTTSGSVSKTVIDGFGSIRDGTTIKYGHGTKIKATAYPSMYCNFIGWYDADDNLVSTDTEIEFTVLSNVAYKAKFEPQPELADYEFYATKTECYLLGVKDKNITHFVVPDVFTHIGSNAFTDCKNLQSVVIGDSVVSIGENAFFSATNLNSVTFGENVKTIGNRAFSNCTSLVEFVVPDTITAIGEYAFENCYNLKSITMGDNVVDIGQYAFSDCIRLSQITISNSIKTINTCTFNNCLSLVEFVVPDSVTVIKSSAFRDCANLTRFTIGKKVNTIEKNCFVYCQKIIEICNKSNLKLQEVEGICDVAKKALHVYSPEFDSTKIIYDNAGFIFYNDNGTYYLCGHKDGLNCSTILVLPDYINGNIYTLYDNAFSNNYNIREVVTSDTIIRFNTSAFNDCTNLVKVTIGSSVTVCVGVIKNAYKFVEVCNTSKALIKDKDGDVNVISKRVRHVYKDGVGSSKLVYDNGFIFYNDNGSYSLIGTESTVGPKLYLPQSINGNTYTIDEYAFYKEIGLKEVVILGGVTAICEYAFAYCSNLEKVTLNDGLQSIGDYAFVYCSNLEEITFGNGLQSIGDYAFAHCSNLEEITLGNGLQSIGDYAFDYCKKLEEITFGNGLQSIGDYAFYHCVEIETLILPSSLVSIGSRAFYANINLKEIYIPKSVTNVGTMAFAYINKDAILYIEASNMPFDWDDVCFKADYMCVLKSEMPTNG